MDNRIFNNPITQEEYEEFKRIQDKLHLYLDQLMRRLWDSENPNKYFSPSRKEYRKDGITFEEDRDNYWQTFTVVLADILNPKEAIKRIQPILDAKAKQDAEGREIWQRRQYEELKKKYGE